VFDCSGLARILIGKFFKSEWISYKKYLPMNTALPFFIEHDGNIEPQTDAIAMKYGWVWRIPVEGRYGCGYVFDSNYTNEEDAFKEVQEYFGSKLTYVKTFKFDAGTYKETSIKNCMAVGLAQSFIEPLEATSIYVTYLNINDFLSSDGIFVKSESFRKKFNERCVTRNNNVRNFVFLHYMSQRNDSDFWKEFRQKHPVIDEVQQTLDLINENEYARIDNDCFSNLSWMQVASGLKLLDSNKFKEKMARLDSESIENYKQSFLTNQENILKTCVSHKDFLDYLRQN
jgi:tryptophan halogenase